MSRQTLIFCAIPTLLQSIRLYLCTYWYVSILTFSPVIRCQLLDDDESTKRPLNSIADINLSVCELLALRIIHRRSNHIFPVYSIDLPLWCHPSAWFKWFTLFRCISGLCRAYPLNRTLLLQLQVVSSSHEPFWFNFVCQTWTITGSW